MAKKKTVVIKGKSLIKRAKAEPTIPHEEPAPVAKPIRKRGRPKLSEEERQLRQREHANKYNIQSRLKYRDIAADWDKAVAGINWERRNACERNLRLFNETYFKPIFYFSWSDDQLTCIRKAEVVVLEGGMFALAMPRGGGKTAICRGTVIWATGYGHRSFPYIIGSSEPKAQQSLNAIKTLWYRNADLRADFPEIAYPIYRLENRYHLARGQVFDGQPTHIEWGSDTVRYPCLLLSKEHAAPYLRNEEVRKTLLGSRYRPFLRYHPVLDRYFAVSSGAYIGTSGIDGSIRGEAEVHPITLEQPRPDVVLLDDVQKDQKAESPASCAKIIRLVDGAVQGLAGPGQHIAALMPCTVIREGDVADTYLDPVKRPEWQGERCQMVTSWPSGITDFEITMDTEASKLWNQYADLRKRSLTLHEDIHLATDFYAQNREAMDRGFNVSWQERYTREGRNRELSPQQHAMELRLKAPDSFPPEFQNRGRRLYVEGEVMVTSPQLTEKIILSLDRRQVPADAHTLVAFIDVQDELLFWSVFACAPDFSGVFCDYGTWPQITTRYFTKNQTLGWNLLSNGFFKDYPEHHSKAVRTESGRIRAPLEAKIYWALGRCLQHLNGMVFTRQDEHQTRMRFNKIAVDTRWGQVSEAIKRLIRDNGDNRVLPYFGQAMPPTHRQFEEFTRTRGWLFEDQVNPRCKEVKWVISPLSDGQFAIKADVNRLKDFLFSRLAAPMGSSGSVALFNDSPIAHELFADHICRSEYPEPLTARGLTKNQWQARPEGGDNDWLDCAVGCMALASICGCFLQHDQTGKFARMAPGRSGGKVSDRWKKR